MPCVFLLVLPITVILAPSNLKDDLVRLPLNLGYVDAFLHHLVERRQLAKLLHDVDQLVRDIINLGLGVEAAQAEADRAVRDIIAKPERLQYIRWLQRRRGAGRPA